MNRAYILTLQIKVYNEATGGVLSASTKIFANSEESAQDGKVWLFEQIKSAHMVVLEHSESGCYVDEQKPK